MDVDPLSKTSSSHRSVVPPVVHVVAYGLLGAVFVWVLAARYVHPLITREPIWVASCSTPLPVIASSSQEPALSDLVEQRIDPNQADWMELTRLPRIGEMLAKRIVAYRDAQQKMAPDGSGRLVAQPVFRAPADLEAVPGIGPKTVERMAPLLKFRETPSPTAPTAPN